MRGYRQAFEAARYAATRGPHPQEEAPQDDPTPSCLATALLLLWAHGGISATAVQHLALQAVLDGVHHQEVTELAGLGTFGAHKGNIGRDIMRLMELENIKIPKPVSMSVPMRDTRTNKVQETVVHCYEPDLLLQGIAAYDDFELQMRTDLVEGFWESVHEDDPKWMYFAMEFDMPNDDLRRTIPLFLHGDKVNYESDDSTMVWHVGSLLSQGQSLISGHMLASIPAKATVSGKDNDTWLPIWQEQIVPGFRRCMQGRCADGSLIHPAGWKFVIWVLTGDHEHFSNCLGMPHWSSKQFCWECHADKGGPITGLTFINGTSGCQRRDVTDEIEGRRSQHPVFTLPGVTRHSIAHDALHVLFNKGVLAHVLGSALHSWCWPRIGRQAHRPEAILANIWQRIKELYTQHAVAGTRLANLHLKMFVDPNAPFRQPPFLKTKAGETKHLLPIVACIAHERDDGSPEAGRLCIVLDAMVALTKLFDEAAVVPSATDSQQAKSYMKTFLTEAQWLRDFAAAQDRKLWHIVPKFHMAEHMVEQFEHLNCSAVWTFKSEDFVGRVAKVAHSVSFGVAARLLSQKIMAKYRVLLHLLYTRKVNDDCDE